MKPLSLERTAEALAYKREYAADVFPLILARLGTTEEELDLGLRRWASAIQTELPSGNPDHVLRFARIYARVMSRIRTRRPAIGSIRPLDDLEAAAHVAPIVHQPPKLDPLKREPSGKAKEQSVVVVVPSYLRSEAPLPALIAPVSREPAGSTKPMTPPFIATTDELPSFDELERLIRAADPQIAIAQSAASHEPVRDPLPAHASSLDGAGREAPDVDATVLVPSPLIAAGSPTGTFRDAMTPVVVPSLSIADYARFRAALRFHGEDDKATFRLFGVASVSVRDALQGQFAKRFQTDPDAQTEFLTLFEGYLRVLNGGKP